MGGVTASCSNLSLCFATSSGHKIRGDLDRSSLLRKISHDLFRLELEWRLAQGKFHSLDYFFFFTDLNSATALCDWGPHEVMSQLIK